MSMGRGAVFAHDGRGVRPFGMLGVSVIVLIAGAAVTQFVSVIMDWTALVDFERNWERSDGTSREWNHHGWVRGVGLSLQFAAGIALLAWLWRARRNAESLCAARHRLPVGWVIGAWVCPVVNLWFPHMIVADVIRASDPRTPTDAVDLRGRPAGVRVTVWWMSVLAGLVLTLVTLVLSLPSPRVERTGDYLVYATAPVGGFGLIVAELIQLAVLSAGATLLGAIVIQVQRWQETRAIVPAAATPPYDGGPRPQPNPDILSGSPPSATPSVPDGPERGDRIVAVVAGVFMAILVAGAVPVVLLGHSDESERPAAADTPQPATSPPARARAPWGPMQLAADKFPNLVPTSQTVADGYRGAACRVDTSDLTTLACDYPPGGVFEPSFEIYCFSHGQDMSDLSGDILVDRLQRPSGTVDIWRREYGYRDPMIIITFENRQQNMCHIFSDAPPDREAEHIQWWRSAPL
ncbi:DUF4328 domain-containing protein [Nocardia thraciensis]